MIISKFLLENAWKKRLICYPLHFFEVKTGKRNSYPQVFLRDKTGCGRSDMNFFYSFPKEEVTVRMLTETVVIINIPAVF